VTALAGRPPLTVGRAAPLAAPRSLARLAPAAVSSPAAIAPLFFAGAGSGLIVAAPRSRRLGVCLIRFAGWASLRFRFRNRSRLTLVGGMLPVRSSLAVVFAVLFGFGQRGLSEH